jgi:ferredoxin
VWKSVPWIASTRARTCWSFIRTNVSIAGFCEPECPVKAIKPDTEPGAEKWLSINARYASLWPNITLKKETLADAKEWERVPDKAQYFSPNPGDGT